MTGLRRPIPTKYMALAVLGALAVSLNTPMHAEQRNGAPIKYMGQGATTAVSTPPYYSGKGYTRAAYSSPVVPVYSQPVSKLAQPENPKTKRIEFRYPDQPNIVHGSDGITRQGQGTPIKYFSQESAIASQSVRKVASVSQPVPIVSKTQKPPVLHQPAYKKPVIEEVAIADIVPVAAPTVKSLAFEPVAQPRFDASGIASWYGEAYHGHPTANGEIFDMHALTAAHPTLPLPSLVQVTNLENGRDVVVRVNDRGPFVPDRLIDLSKRAADELGFLITGEANVSVRYLGPAPLDSAAAGQGASVSQVQARHATTALSEPRVPQPRPTMQPIPNPIGPAYFIQAGSFSEMSNAERFSNELGGALPVDVAMANVNGADFFRVLIGPYNSRSEAQIMRDQLDESGIVNGVLITGQK